jgi:hypothetical protein
MTFKYETLDADADFSHLIGSVIDFDGQPYYSGTATITGIKVQQDGMFKGYLSVELLTIEYWTTGRLGGHTSSRYSTNPRTLNFSSRHPRAVESSVAREVPLIYVY